MKRPLCITIIGVIFIITGCLTAWDIIADLFRNRLNLNFGVLMAPVGFGLLRGRSSSRGWAKFWIGLFSIGCGLLLVCYPFFGDSYSVTWLGDEQLLGFSRYAMVIGFPTAFLICAWFMWRSLSSSSVAPFFDDYMKQNAEPAAPSNR
jgi:hypothetical protein